ncbi:MAG: glycosyltransferase family 2 protein [Patescibacteria group bacterium]
MPLPKVSICIPAYKQIEYLRKNLESIKAQNYLDYEIVLTDDSPNNDVNNLVKSFNFQDKLRYFKNQKTLGSPENWNEAIRHAKGEYIKILHHDDWFTDKNSLKEFVKMLDDNPKMDFAFSASLVLDTRTNLNHINSPSKKQRRVLARHPKSLFFGNIIGAPSATIYKSSIKEIFDNKLKWVVDIDFYIRLLNKNREFTYCKKPLICTPNKASHQVTQLCKNNKEIELFEYIFLFSKIYNKDTKLSKYYIFFINLFKKYNVTSMDMFDQLNIKAHPMDFYQKVMKDKSIMNLNNINKVESE